MVHGVRFRAETGSSKQDILFHLDLLPMEGWHPQDSLSGGHWSIGEALTVCPSPLVIVSLFFFFLLAPILFTFINFYKWPGGTLGDFLAFGDQQRLQVTQQLRLGP